MLGKKIGMTQIFLDDGKMVPVTVIEAGPCVVTQVKEREKDGYEAVQIGYQEVKKENVNKPIEGHFKKAKVAPQKYLAELLLANGENYELGQVLTVESFTVGERADVTGVSKGKGFQGVVKRWGFKGGPKSHGSHFQRAPGSVGASATPSRVVKGKKLPGQMGNARVSVQNLEVVQVDSDKNLLFLKGAVPGSKGGLLMIKSSVKASSKGKK
uniref:Large ribosomal subunit protein uL3 n=1 Tax=uncultured actinobacterium Rifle_16ft_4_minimus_550 TaxID=1665149 RepID=A0A0H4TUE6_9ACTN|nr:50S ribosomal protein L3, large subunit ribosomal protein L3 [uncultured actinobacterium Rifle_16ft_4_minimus_550]